MYASGTEVADEDRKSNFICFLNNFWNKRSVANMTKCKYLFMLGNGHTGVCHIILQIFLFSFVHNQGKKSK